MSDYQSYFKNLQTVNSCLETKDQLSQTGRFEELKNLLKTSSGKEKATFGQELNELKKSLQIACDERILQIQTEQEKDNYVDFDPTFYSNNYQSTSGFTHPITQIMDEIVEIFENMGFDVADGPLVETQDYCFTKLNLPDYHPARAMQDTFFLQEKDEIGENYVLRTHTSSVQIRYGQSHTPPFRIVSPGRVYRNENIDATHDIMFHQVECLIVAQRVSLSHLKTLIEGFYSRFFGQNNIQARLRPSYFSYTIPSLEVDISNPFKNNPNSRIKSDWIEVGGAGLVHPDVIRNIGLNPDQWQGLAFGFGIDRMAQLKLGVSGIGQFFNGHLSFLRGK